MFEKISNEIVEIIINDKEVDIKDFDWYISDHIVSEPQIAEKHNDYWLLGYEIIVPTQYESL